MSVNLVRRTDTAVAPMVLTVPLTVGFVVLRWWDAAGQRLGRFVVAGSTFAQPQCVPAGLPVVQGNGYDGQFYYRLALDPFDLSRAAFGIRLDSMSRIERMFYPFLAWVVSLGHHGAVPLALVVVNVVAAAVAGLAGGMVARSAGRHALWGLVFPLYWGYLWTIGRDLTELTAESLLLLGLAAWLRHRPGWAALAFLGAVLSKETAVLLVATLGVTEVGRRLSAARSDPTRTRRGLAGLELGTDDLVYLVPLAGFAVFELVLWAATGALPIFESGGQNLSFPLTGLFHGIAHYASGAATTTATGLWVVELCLLVVLAVSAGLVVRQVRPELAAMWGMSVLLALSAAGGIWAGDVGFRSLDDSYVLGWVLILFGSRRAPILAVLCAGMWCVVAGELIRYV